MQARIDRDCLLTPEWRSATESEARRWLTPAERCRMSGQSGCAAFDTDRCEAGSEQHGCGLWDGTTPPPSLFKLLARVPPHRDLAQAMARLRPGQILHIVGDSSAEQWAAAARCELRRTTNRTDGDARVLYTRVGQAPDRAGLASLRHAFGLAAFRADRSRGDVVLATLGLHYNDGDREAYGGRVG